MDYPWIILDYPWIIHGLSMDYPWIIHGLSMDYPWIIPGLSLDNPRTAPGAFIFPEMTPKRKLFYYIWPGSLGRALGRAPIGPTRVL